MCKKYVNVSARCYKSVTSVDNSVMSYDIPFTSIRHDDDKNGVSVSKFTIVTTIDFLGTNNETHKTENPLESKRKLDFIIRLTKCSNDENKRIGYDLEKFSIDLEDIYKNDQVNKACFDYVNYTRITKIDKLGLPGGLGKYVIKILIKDAKEDDYTIQTMSPLTVV